MRNFSILARALFVLLLTSGLSVAFVNAEDAKASPEAVKKIFTDNKCNVCHSIKIAAIEKKSSTSKAPDLSSVGSKHSADWIIKFLNKQETLNDKKHSKAWAGKPEDLKTLAGWLETLKEKEDIKN